MAVKSSGHFIMALKIFLKSASLMAVTGDLFKIIRRCSSETSPPYFRLLVFIWQWILFYFIQSFLQIAPEFFLHFLGQFLCISFTIFHQKLCIYFPWIGMFFNQCIQMWLCKFRIIAFIMTMTAITNHINKNIRIKFLAVTCCNFSTFYYSFRIIAIYMQVPVPVPLQPAKYNNQNFVASSKSVVKPIWLLITK